MQKVRRFCDAQLGFPLYLTLLLGRELSQVWTSAKNIQHLLILPPAPGGAAGDHGSHLVIKLLCFLLLVAEVIWPQRNSQESVRFLRVI